MLGVRYWEATEFVATAVDGTRERARCIGDGTAACACYIADGTRERARCIADGTAACACYIPAGSGRSKGVGNLYSSVTRFLPSDPRASERGRWSDGSRCAARCPRARHRQCHPLAPFSALQSGVGFGSLGYVYRRICSCPTDPNEDLPKPKGEGPHPRG